MTIKRTIHGFSGSQLILDDLSQVVVSSGNVLTLDGNPAEVKDLKLGDVLEYDPNAPLRMTVTRPVR